MCQNETEIHLEKAPSPPEKRTSYMNYVFNLPFGEKEPLII